AAVGFGPHPRPLSSPTGEGSVGWPPTRAQRGAGVEEGVQVTCSRERVGGGKEVGGLGHRWARRTGLRRGESVHWERRGRNSGPGRCLSSQGLAPTTRRRSGQDGSAKAGNGRRKD